MATTLMEKMLMTCNVFSIDSIRKLYFKKKKESIMKAPEKDEDKKEENALNKDEGAGQAIHLAEDQQPLTKN